MYKVNGEVVESIREVSKVLGTKVSKKDVLGGLVEGVELVTENTINEEDLVVEAVGKQDKEVEEVTTDDEAVSQLDEVISDEEAEAIIERVANKVLGDKAVEEVTEDDTEEEVIDGDIPDLERELVEAEGSSVDSPEVVINPDKVVNPEPKQELVGTDKGNQPLLSLEELKAKLASNYKKAVEKDPSLVKAKKKPKVEYDLTIREYPVKGSIETKEELNEFMRTISNEQLLEWIERDNLEHTPNTHAGVDRMLKMKAIRDSFFPAVKKQAKYAKYTTEELVGMVIENDIVLREDKGDDRILRMNAIMELRKAGIIE